MPTKLSRYAEGVMEAGWLAAIIMTPLFFNKYSSRIFEPDKATLLRTLALIIVLAWVVKVVDVALTHSKGKSEKLSLMSVLQTPIVGPVILLAMAYIIATILSVAPRISFWGSYQRLQGMYTTFAYLVLFASLAANLRRQSQVERLITTAILVSLPISLYGILQRYGIDPIPWGGDVTYRVASHMGNPIFVAAFLILTFPLTVGRIVDAFQKILTEPDGLSIQTARATTYIFIAALQLITLYFTQSRGPWLGLFAGGFFLCVLLSLHWRKQWMTIAVLVFAVLAGTFLVVLNIKDGPLQPLKANPSFSRLGKLLDPQSRTARVRSLIWGGSFEMVTPHEPLEYPDGRKDPFNLIRPLIGYGPESMHMAYNPFYPPELAHVEKRNASPDRSHNETWDSMVFTGLLGLIAYLSMFTAVFYNGLKWLGLIDTSRKRWAFFSIYFSCGVISAVIFAQWQGIAFAGLGLPFGLILGLILYLGVIAIFTGTENPNTKFSEARSLTLIVLLAAVVAHFAEINFGISIVSTKTYFFTYAALILAVGHTLPQAGEYRVSSEPASLQVREGRVKAQRRKRKPRQSTAIPKGLGRSIAIGAGIGSLLLIPMMYEYVSNLWGLTSTNEVLWTSLTQVKPGVISYGVLALVLTTWISASIILTSEVETPSSLVQWGKVFASIAGISMLVSLIYGSWLSGSLARLARFAPQSIDDIVAQTAGLESLLTQYYGVIILLILALGAYLPENWSTRSKNPSPLGLLVAIAGFVLVIWMSIATNLQVIHADTAFKMAEPFASSRQWAVANVLYRRAIELAPDEDYYYLFLGRGALETAKSIKDPLEQEKVFLKAEEDLLKAQKINPLNPDHTANLARLHSWWAMQAPDEAEKLKRGKVSDYYFSRVTVLSPNNARLWDEWAILHLNVLQDPNRALQLLTHSLDIDPEYDWTHAILGDLYSRMAQSTASAEEQKEAYLQAVAHYRKAVELQSKNLNYYYALASAYQALGEPEMVIETLEASLEIASESEIWKIEDNLTQFYLQLKDYENAILHAQNALLYAPDSERERFQAILDQLYSLP